MLGAAGCSAEASHPLPMRCQGHPSLRTSMTAENVFRHCQRTPMRPNPNHWFTQLPAAQKKTSALRSWPLSQWKSESRTQSSARGSRCDLHDILGSLAPRGQEGTERRTELILWCCWVSGVLGMATEGCSKQWKLTFSLDRHTQLARATAVFQSPERNAHVQESCSPLTGHT